VLTTLLKDTLGGNSKTIMLCNISPSNVDRAATIDTLQFASMAGNIRNQVGEIKAVERALSRYYLMKFATVTAEYFFTYEEVR